MFQAGERKMSLKVCCVGFKAVFWAPYTWMFGADENKMKNIKINGFKNKILKKEVEGTFWKDLGIKLPVLSSWNVWFSGFSDSGYSQGLLLKYVIAVAIEASTCWSQKKSPELFYRPTFSILHQ